VLALTPSACPAVYPLREVVQSVVVVQLHPGVVVAVVLYLLAKGGMSLAGSWNFHPDAATA
jgi:hypothetical protein